MSRPLNDAEMLAAVMEHLQATAEYWIGLNAPDRVKVNGVVYGILCLLDGVTVLPGFALVPEPMPEDRAFFQSRGENWWPEPGDMNGTTSIGDPSLSLRELWLRKYEVK